MQNISHLLKLEFMMDRSVGGKRKKIVSQVLSYFLIAVFSTLLSLFFVFAFKIIGNASLVIGQLSFVLIVLMIVLFIFSLSLLLKRVFFFKKKETLSYVPVRKTQIYFAKVIYCFVKTEFLNIVLTLPAIFSFFAIYGFSVEYYFIGFGVLFLIPIFPFALANLILIPTMYVLNFFKDKNILSLIFTIAVVVVMFYFYMQIVFEVAEILLSKNEVVANLLESVIEFCEIKSIPSCMVASAILKVSSLKNLIIFIVLTVSMAVVGLLAGALSYKSIFVASLSKKTSSKIIKTKSRKRNPFMAYFFLELKELFRNSNMLFSYVGMSVAMPFMVVYCNKFTIDFAVEKIGNGIITGVMLFVVMLFVSIICSPVSIFISKEGDRFWILKTNPNGIKLPLFAKSLVGVCFAGCSLVVTVLIVCISKYISWICGALIFAIGFVYIFALVSFGLVCNLSMPNIFYAEKENTSNIFIMLLFGFVVSTSLGMFAIIKSFSMATNTILLIGLTVVSLLAIMGIVVLLTQYKRLYAKMEV